LSSISSHNSPINIELPTSEPTPRVANPLEGGSEYMEHLNPKSLEVLKTCRVEPGLKGAALGSRFQFERVGYFCTDPVDSSDKALVFNRTVTLRDTWAKISEKEKR